MEFFQEHTRLFLTAHILSVVLGLGGATVADILFFNFLKDLRISKKEADVLQTVSLLIVIALPLLLLSGVGLFLSDIERFSASAPFKVKLIMVLVITLNGVLMHSYVSPRLIQLSFLKKSNATDQYAHRLRHAAFAMGAVSVVSWYATFFLSMLKSYTPSFVSFSMLVGIYGAMLLMAVSVSQWLCRDFAVRRRK